MESMFGANDETATEEILQLFGWKDGNNQECQTRPLAFIVQTAYQMNHLPDLPTRVFVWLVQLKLAAHSQSIMAGELSHTHGTKKKNPKRCPFPMSHTQILLLKKALSSVQFAAITAIKNAFSLLPHLMSQLMCSRQQWWGGC